MKKVAKAKNTRTSPGEPENVPTAVVPRALRSPPATRSGSGGKTTSTTEGRNDA